MAHEFRHYKLAFLWPKRGQSIRIYLNSYWFYRVNFAINVRRFTYRGFICAAIDRGPYCVFLASVICRHEMLSILTLLPLLLLFANNLTFISIIGPRGIYHSPRPLSRELSIRSKTVCCEIYCRT